MLIPIHRSLVARETENSSLRAGDHGDVDGRVKSGSRCTVRWRTSSSRPGAQVIEDIGALRPRHLAILGCRSASSTASLEYGHFVVSSVQP